MTLKKQVISEPRQDTNKNLKSYRCGAKENGVKHEYPVQKVMKGHRKVPNINPGD